MRIEQIKRPGKEWDEFAEAHPQGRLGHASAWATVLNRTYGLEPHYLGAWDETGALGGILPLVAFKSRPGGSQRLISLPFLDGAGILAADPDIAKVLFDHAIRRVQAGGFQGLELRVSPAIEQPSNAPAPFDRVNLVMSLESSEEAQWQALRAKVRNQTRKAERDGLTLAEDGTEDLLERFYDPFRVNMRDLGSPVHSVSFFAAAAREFGDRLRFIVSQDRDRPVGGLVAIRFANRVSVPWASTLRAERKRCPNNQIYWEALSWAIRSGATDFDFGRSPRNQGTYRFKKGWGAVEEPLEWLKFGPDGARIQEHSSSPSAVFRSLSSIWTRLPVPLASFMGSRIRGYFSN